MSIIKHFNELHIGLKTCILTIVCQMPFFFIASFLFKHNLIDNISSYPLIDMDFWFLISLCFCFSLTWFLMNVALTFSAISFADKMTKTDSEPHELYIASMMYSLFYLSISIVISYYFNLTFNSFLLWAYSYITARVGWIILWTLILRKHL